MNAHNTTRAVSPTSEGQQTVQDVFHNAHIVLPYPATELQLTLQETQRHTERASARKVLAPKAQPPAALQPGGCHHDCDQARKCNCGHTQPDPQAPDLIDRLGLERRPLLSLSLILFGVLALIELAPIVAAALR